MKTIGKKFDFDDLFTFEIANNHQGSVAHGKKIIDAMAKIAKKHKLKAAIKFQFRDIKTFIHPEELTNKDNKHVQRFLSTELSEKQFAELIAYARKSGLLVMTTPFDERSVDLAEKLDADIIKVASCSAKDWPLLEKISKVSKPVIASTGGMMIKDIDNLVSFFDHQYVHFAIMHCVAVYPTLHGDLQLGEIDALKSRYPHITIGFSTHEEPDNVEAIQIAYAKGARIFERHVGIPSKTIKLNGYSSTPEQIEKWIESYKRAVSANGVERGKNKKEQKDLELLKRGVFATRVIKKGEKLTSEGVFFAFPIKKGQLSSGMFKEGMVADKNYKKNAAISLKLADKSVHDKHIIYEIIHDVKGLLNEARVPVGIDNDVEISHHYGLKNFKDWGVVIIDCINREYCKKILVQLPGQDHPVHHHKKKEEAFHVLSGEIIVTLEGEERLCKAGDVMIIKRGVRHSFKTDTGAIFEEVSTTHFNEDSLYEDPNIAKMPREKRKTKLINWGRHQFD